MTADREDVSLKRLNTLILTADRTKKYMVEEMRRPANARGRFVHSVCKDVPFIQALDPHGAYK
jgi:hypothetical protein